MNAVPFKNDFWKLTNLTSTEAEAVRFKVPVDYRYFEGGHWFVHKKFLRMLGDVGRGQQPPPHPYGNDYALLHLRDTAPRAIVDAAYRVLVKMYHPDKGGDSDKLRGINEAYHRITKK